VGRAAAPARRGPLRPRAGAAAPVCARQEWWAGPRDQRVNAHRFAAKVLSIESFSLEALDL